LVLIHYHSMIYNLTVMKNSTLRTILFVFSIVLTNTQSFADVTKTVGATGANYATLKAAFDDINNGNIKTGIITLQIINNTTETASAVLNASGGSSSYTFVRIYPTVPGLSISGNLILPLVNLDGADNVTIDGSVGGNDSTVSLSISNTNITSGKTVQFINSAQNNTLKYCNIQGTGTTTTGGTIFFSTASSGEGNDGNTITNCNITGRTVNAIYSSGSASPNENSGNTINSNNIYDVWSTNSSSYAIYIDANSTDYSITANSFYETTSFAAVINTYTFASIYINNASGNNFTISGNYIGGRSLRCGGTSLTLGASNSNLTYYPVFMNAGTTTASNIQGNTIKNIAYGRSTSAFSIIQIDGGIVNIGTVTGNNIGEVTGTGSISLNSNSTVNSFGIQINSSGTSNVLNNTIGSVSTSNSDATKSHSFYGIYKSGVGGNITVKGNIIGSITTAGSIITSSASSSNIQILYGIYSAATGTIDISDNTVVNLQNATTGTSLSLTRGIRTDAGSNIIKNNLVHDIITSNVQANNYVGASLIGISLHSMTAGTTQNITENTVYNLKNTAASAIEVYGIFFQGSTTVTNTVSKNYVHSLSIPNSSDASYIHGISLYEGVATVSNNIVLLGNADNIGYNIFGIWKNSINPINFYHNTVYISGTTTSGTKSTFAFRDLTNGTSAARDIRNNLFVNARSNNPSTLTCRHYCIYLGSTNNLTLNYNNYWVSGVGGIIGSSGGPKTVLPIVTGQDVNSLNKNPYFINAGSTITTDYKPKKQLQGDKTLLPTIPDDYGIADIRAIPTPGAWEKDKNFWKGTTNTDWITTANWTANYIPCDEDDVEFATVDNIGYMPSNDLYLDFDRAIGYLINASDKKLVIPTAKCLTVINTIITDNNPDRIYLQSGSTSANGSLIFHNASDAPVQATVEMYSKASKVTNYKWQFFGIPVRTMLPSPVFDGSYVRKMFETGTTNAEHWVQLQNASVMNSFTGYEITQLTPKTIYFQGELENGNFNSGKLSYTPAATYPGQHLIGNPYTAAIDIKKIIFGSADSGIIENTVYLYNTGSYAEWESEGSGTISGTGAGQYIAVPVLNAGLNGLPSQIPTMQAFLIKVNSDNALATVSIPYSAAGTVVKNTTMQRLKTEKKAGIRIDVNGSRFSDQMWIFTEANCTHNFDNGWDGYKFGGSSLSPQLFAMEPDGDYQVSTVDDINNTELGFSAGEDSMYTLTFTSENPEEQYTELFLIDLLENTTTDITQSGTAYSFSVDTVATSVKRFKIVTDRQITTKIEKTNADNIQLRIFNSHQTLMVNNTGDSSGDLFIFDITGRIIQKHPFGANCITTISTDLPAGSYIVTGKAGSNKKTIHVIIN